MNIQTGADFISQVLRGNADAQRFLADTMLALSFWDDLADGKPVTRARVDEAMWATFLELPANPFYRTHFATLHPILRMIVLQWVAATAIEADEKASDDQLMLAYVDRQSWTTLLLACAMAVNGAAGTAGLAGSIRRFGVGGGFQKYLEALRAARVPREAA